MKTSVQALAKRNNVNTVVDALQALNPSHRLFLSHYLDRSNTKTFLNAFQSYIAAYPNSSKDAAYVSACHLLRKPSIKAVLDQIGVSRGDIERNLMYVQVKALESDDLARFESANMNLAKIKGYLVERTEVKHVDEGQKSRIDSLIDTELSRNN